MTQGNIYNSLLVDYCGGDYENVSQFLKAYPNLDVTYSDGACFNKAIMRKNSKIVSALLDYYKTHQLSSDKDSIEYKKALFNLKHILEEAEEMYKFSPEIQELLKPYIGSDEDMESDADIRDLEIEAELRFMEASKDDKHSTPDADIGSGHSDHESDEDLPHHPQQNTYVDWSVILGNTKACSDSGHEGDT